MLSAILLMLLTGLLWTLVAIVFGSAPSDRDRLYTFFIIQGAGFAALVWLTQTPAAAPAKEILRLSGIIAPSAVTEALAFLMLKRAMDRGSQGIAWSVAQSAMVISFLGSILFFRNPSFAGQWAGLAGKL